MTVKELDIEQIERAIAQLPPKELAELVGWIEDYQAEVWDKQIEEELEAGRLDKVLAEVEDKYAAGLAEPL